MDTIQSIADEELFLSKILLRMVDSGLTLESVADEEEFYKCHTVVDAMAHATAVENCVIRFRDSENNKFSLIVVWGNGQDIVADYTDSPHSATLEKIIDQIIANW
jgi:hypothetical protein